MQIKTRGIVLSFIKYKESSIIAKLYTEELGAVSCIVNSVRSVKSRSNKIALYQALTLLDLVIYYRPNQNLHRISEAKMAYPYHSIPFDIGKSSIALFLTEILGKVLKEEEKNEELFEFMLDNFQTFDELSEGYSNFHLKFLIQLAEFLGFGIFSVSNFVEELHLTTVNEKSLVFFANLLHTEFHHTISANREIRHEVLTWLIHFYKIHFENFGGIKSLEVLKEVLSD
ncbi:MAG: DNA repair protein RecO [Flammeovirgaceae bacterium]